jgi:hypothetical protein
MVSRNNPFEIVRATARGPLPSSSGVGRLAGGDIDHALGPLVYVTFGGFGYRRFLRFCGCWAKSSSNFFLAHTMTAQFGNCRLADLSHFC